MTLFFESAIKKPAVKHNRFRTALRIQNKIYDSMLLAALIESKETNNNTNEM